MPESLVTMNRNTQHRLAAQSNASIKVHHIFVKADLLGLMRDGRHLNFSLQGTSQHRQIRINHNQVTGMPQLVGEVTMFAEKVSVLLGDLRIAWPVTGRLIYHDQVTADDYRCIWRRNWYRLIECVLTRKKIHVFGRIPITAPDMADAEDFPLVEIGRDVVIDSLVVQAFDVGDDEAAGSECRKDDMLHYTISFATTWPTAKCIYRHGFIRSPVCDG